MRAGAGKLHQPALPFNSAKARRKASPRTSKLGNWSKDAQAGDLVGQKVRLGLAVPGPDAEQHAAGDLGEKFARMLVELEPEPRDQQAEQAAVSYQKAAQTAFRETADGLVNAEQSARQQDEVGKQLVAAREVVATAPGDWRLRAALALSTAAIASWSWMTTRPATVTFHES